MMVGQVVTGFLVLLALAWFLVMLGIGWWMGNR